MRIILKINVNGSIEPFTSLEKMFCKYPELRAKKSSMVSYLTRKKVDFVSDAYTLRRCFVNET
jgi:hypothetical protein